jgi:hypothetical protein
VGHANRAQNRLRFRALLIDGSLEVRFEQTKICQGCVNTKMFLARGKLSLLCTALIHNHVERWQAIDDF